MEEQSNYEKEIDIKKLIIELLKKTKILILTGVILAILIIGFKFLTSGSAMLEDTRITYKPSSDFLGIASIFLGSESTTITSTTARTYLTGNEMLEGAIDKLNLDLDYAQLKSMIYLNSSTDTMININVTGSDEKMVKDITDYLATVGSNNLIVKLTNPSVTLLEPAYTVYREYNVQIPEKVQSIPKLIKGLSKYAIIGFLLGIFIAAVVYLFYFILDGTIKDERDVQRYLGIPIMGSISVIKSTKKQVEKEKSKKKPRLSQYSK